MSLVVQRLNVINQLTDSLQHYISTTVAQELTAAENNTNQQSSTTDEETADSQPVLHEVPVDIRLIDEKGQFIGLGAVSLNGRLQPKKLIQL